MSKNKSPKLKEVYNALPSFKFMIDTLELSTPFTLRYLNEICFYSDQIKIESNCNDIATVITRLHSDKDTIDEIRSKLHVMREIRGSINNINRGNTLDDIELFEIKSFALIYEEIRSLFLSAFDSSFMFLPDLAKVVALLDPDNSKMTMFYIYDSYSEELAAIRKEIKILSAETIDAKTEALRLSAEALEDSIRERLSSELSSFAEDLDYAFNGIIRLDILIAKALQSTTWNLCKPSVSSHKTIITAMTNPFVADALNKVGGRFQPVNISLDENPCLITGANMSGKTVVLKTIACIQYLFQFGFFIPAIHAEIKPVDAIMLSMGDGQDETQGLSSFAAEILKINDIIKHIKNDNKTLVLIDEPARTTNPIEGSKIVNAILKMLSEYKVMSLVTTHYDDIMPDVRRLRVKGLTADENELKQVTKDNINNFIDYSLIDTDNKEVPQEAIKIAKILGVDVDFLKNIE